MVATTAGIDPRRAAELSHPHHERLVQQGRDNDVVEHGQVEERPRRLEGASDAGAGDHGRVEAGDVFAPQGDAAAVRAVRAGDVTAAQGRAPVGQAGTQAGRWQ